MLHSKIFFQNLLKNSNYFRNITKFSKIKSSNVKKSSLHLQKHQFSTELSSHFIFNTQNEPELLKLQLQYKAHLNAAIFQQSIKQSTGFLEQMNIFKIFRVLESSPFKLTSYQQFFDFIQKHLKKKSDNMLLLLSTVKQRIARYYTRQNKIQLALQHYQQSLDILQRSLVPPLYPYYSVYRQYGLLHDQIGEKQKAKQILTQSVNILEDFVSHSDDNVSTNDYCKKQATAFNTLVRIDEGNRKKWLQKANSIWQKYTQNKYNQIEYAKTVGQNVKRQIKQDKQKGEAYYHFNLYKFQNKEMKDIIKKTKQENV